MYQLLTDKQKKYIYLAVLFSFVFLALFLLGKTLSVFKEYSYIGRGVYPSNVISVNGTADVYAVADVASFTYSVVETGKTAKEAQDKAAKKSADILAAIRALGVPEKDIKTTGYNLYPKYEWVEVMCVTVPCRGGSNKLVGYELSESVEVKVRTETKIDAGEVLAKVGSLGASNVSGLSLTVDDIESFKTQARAQAILDAKEKAKVLAEALGVELKEITSFYDNTPSPYYGMGGDMMEAKAMPMSATPEIVRGENKVTAQVTITYEIDN